VIDSIVADLPPDVSNWFVTPCEVCAAEARVRWFECAYLVECPHCAAETSLENDSMAKNENGRAVPGKYRCSTCELDFRTASIPRAGHKYLNARVRCGSCGHHATRAATSDDVRLAEEIASSEAKLVAKFGLQIPYVPIPLDWDRQSEDALSRKGFKEFSDLFTSRNRIITAFLLKGLEDRKNEISREDFIGSLLCLSALIRYVNNMTVATAGWMDGRPVAWAKHAYWMPSQFVECNPFEYLEHRLKALRQGAKDRDSRFTGKVGSEDPLDVVTGSADFSVQRCDARNLGIPTGSVDAVVTDPPFGSNVQYGELTDFWSVWLENLNPYQSTDHIPTEILMTRRKKAGAKTAADYQRGLTEVFLECHRVLKQDGVLVFTFNNKDPNAWNAVMSAALDAGFSLRSDDISYQSEIHAYRDTAHLRFSGELQGDVLYKFHKASSDAPLESRTTADLETWSREARSLLCAAEDEQEIQAHRVAIHIDSLAYAADAIQGGRHDEAGEWMEVSRKIVSGARLKS
jgi:SAM-dependent methyltransferase